MILAFADATGIRTQHGDFRRSDFGASQRGVEAVAGDGHVVLHALRHHGGDIGAADPAAGRGGRRRLTRLER